MPRAICCFGHMETIIPPFGDNILNIFHEITMKNVVFPPKKQSNQCSEDIMRRIGILQCKSSLSWSRYNHAYSQYLSENEEIRSKKMASVVACNTSPSINIKHKNSMIREISSCSIVPSLVSQNIHKKKVSNFKNITSAVTPIHNQLCQNYYQKSFFSSGKTYSSIGNSTLDFKNDDVRKFLDQEKIKYNESRHCNDYVIGMI